jgi:hypothetical protein
MIRMVVGLLYLVQRSNSYMQLELDERYFLKELKTKRWNQVWNLNLSITYFFRKITSIYLLHRKRYTRGQTRGIFQQWDSKHNVFPRSKSISTILTVSKGGRCPQVRQEKPKNSPTNPAHLIKPNIPKLFSKIP